MGKLILIAAIGALACWRLTGKWPWQLWREWSVPAPTQRARKLLGVSAQDGRDEILAAHKRLITRVHPDRGGDVEQVHAANAARDLLLRQLPKL